MIKVITGSSGRRYVYDIEAIVNAQGKRSSVKRRNFGRLDLLLDKDPQALDKLKAKYNPPGGQRARKQEHNLQDALSALQPTAQYRVLLPVNYSMMILLRLWEDDLRLDYKLRYLRSRDGLEVKTEDFTAFLCFLKVIDPQSLRSSFDCALQYVGDFLRGATLGDLYRCYDFLALHHDDIMAHVNNRLDGVVREQRSVSLIFYDVTNVYFESPYTDEERGRLRPGAQEKVHALLDAARREPVPAGSEPLPADDEVLDRPEALARLPPALRQQLREAMYLRLRGPSKEHRCDLPLVSAALTVDEWNFPIDVQLYPGCASEYKTMEASVTRLQQKYHAREVVLVADRGLNSAANLAMLLNRGLGFLVAQQVGKLDPGILEQLGDWQGFTPMPSIAAEGDEPEVGLSAAAGDDELTPPLLGCHYRHFAHYLKTNGRRQIVCDLVVTFSSNRYLRDRRQLDDDWRRAETAVATHAEVNGSRRAWTALVRRDKTTPKARALNHDAYRQRLKLCGLAAMLYHAAPDKDAPGTMTPEQVVTAYRRLNRIEDSFRVMKSTLSLRPMFVRTEQHIHGHILVCTLALVLIRLIQRRLAAVNRPLSTERIAAALSGAMLLPLQLNTEKYDNDLLYLHAGTNCPLPRAKASVAEREIKTIPGTELLRLYQHDRDLASIMQVCGLDVPPNSFRRPQLSECLRHRFVNDPEVAPQAGLASA